MAEKIYANGKIFELVHIEQPDGRVLEVARRAPGVRLILADLTLRQVLLTKEFRHELSGFDYRLPGGKVFDTLAEFEKFRETGADIVPVAAKKAAAEAHEEAGVEADDIKLFKKSTLGATVEWDLYVFETTDWQYHESGQQLETGEQVEGVAVYDFAEVEQMILRGDMAEERIALILLQWLKQHAR